jgi:Bacterial nucleoid DNA-binding protein
MNTTELTSALAKKLKLNKGEAIRRMEDAVDVITQELQNGKTIAITNFGSLEVTKRNERVGVHPSSGKKILIPPKLVLKFKAGNSLKESIKSLRP